MSISFTTPLCSQSTLTPLALPSVPCAAWMLVRKASSLCTALKFITVRSASFATSAACTMRLFCTYLPGAGRSTIWFSWAAFRWMLRRSSSFWRPSRAFCTRFSASALATAMSSSRCCRAVSMAIAFRWVCCCCQASALRWFSCSHSRMSFSWKMSCRSARSARRCSPATCRASSAFSAFSCRRSRAMSSSICRRSSRIRCFSAFHSRS